MKDNTFPAGPWEFNAEVAACFPDMLARSIPELSLMRRTISEVANAAHPNLGVIVDHGCSLGATLETFAEPGRALYGFDNSAPMLEGARRRLGDTATLELLDIATGTPEHPPADLTAYVLTLQFLAQADRPSVLAGALGRAAPGGLLVVAEKVQGQGWTRGPLVEAYHGRKQANGYTLAQVEAKATALQGVMEPLTGPQVEAEITAAGWQGVECIWRCLNFSAWIARKPAA